MVSSGKLPLPSSFHIQFSMPGKLSAESATLTLMNYHRNISKVFITFSKGAKKLSKNISYYWAAKNKRTRGICSQFYSENVSEYNPSTLS